MEAANRARAAKSINKRQLQSLIGKLVHIAKCVEPARIFISRLLDALRAMGPTQFVRITDDMRADMDWFREFVADWNGTSIIPATKPHRVIQVDACLTGVGGTDGTLCYATSVAPKVDPIANITELEAANVVVALHTFLSPVDAGGHILVKCDNLPAVQALTTGRAHNKILAECVRAAWMIQAKYAIRISFSHIAGILNPVADALSWAHTSQAHHNLALDYITKGQLVNVKPCTYVPSHPIQIGSGTGWRTYARVEPGHQGRWQHTGGQSRSW